MSTRQPGGHPDVYAIRYASRVSTKGENFLNFHLYGEPDTVLTVDYFYWVIRDDAGITVVDTGFAPDAGRRRGRIAESTPVMSLPWLGLDADDVDRVVITHAHYDHIGNVGEFPGAEVIMSQAEYDFWTSPVASRSQFSAWSEAAEIAHLTRLRAQGRLTLVSGEHRAHGLTLLEAGGHTPGQLVVRAGDILLTSDAVHFYEELERLRPFAVMADLPAAYRTYDLLNELAARSGVRLVPGHDPRVRTMFPTEGDVTCLTA